jgi:NAD(P)-dependent dehydrogenase (short-subunit alcohol dehydrogenase family)
VTAPRHRVHPPRRLTGGVGLRRADRAPHEAPEDVDARLRRLELMISRRLEGLLHGDHLGLLPGHGSERAESREYRLGDDVRRMDWAVTARTTVPHVSDMIADRELTTYAVVDLTPSMHFGTHTWEKRDLALANYAVYCASKAAVNMLTRSLAIEFGRDGVHVNCIAPGNTATPMNENLRTEAQYKGFVDMMGARTPSGRTYSQPEEMAAMALYLSCADSKPVHGAIMVMDEGFSLGV